MDDKKIIKQFFAEDNPPARIISIDKLDDGSDRCYKVKGEDVNGNFTAEVGVRNDEAFILPT